MRYAVIAHQSTDTHTGLMHATPSWSRLSPAEALRTLREGDVALGRLDVLPSLDGVEPGLWALGELGARGVQVLNTPSVLLACHDKLLTARLLTRAGLPHPRTHLVQPTSRDLQNVADGWVLKPRYGSWGGGVSRGHGNTELRDCLESARTEIWFLRQGALVQELIPPRGYDLRVVVAAGRVVGAVTLVCADGEWRTNVALGARRLPATVPPGAAALALAAAHVVDAALIGIDLLPNGDGWTILELNAAVEFNHEYAPGHDIHSDAARELALLAQPRQHPAHSSTLAVAPA